jgi:hypothetical protein
MFSIKKLEGLFLQLSNSFQEIWMHPLRIYPAAPKPKTDYSESIIGSLRHPQGCSQVTTQRQWSRTACHWVVECCLSHADSEENPYLLYQLCLHTAHGVLHSHMGDWNLVLRLSLPLQSMWKHPVLTHELCPWAPHEPGPQSTEVGL